jgi:3-deoxy-D-manno-octulosonic-acid transferase
MRKKSWKEHQKIDCNLYSYSFPRYNNAYLCWLGCDRQFITREDILRHFIAYHEDDKRELRKWGYEYNVMLASVNAMKESEKTSWVKQNEKRKQLAKEIRAQAKILVASRRREEAELIQKGWEASKRPNN